MAKLSNVCASGFVRSLVNPLPKHEMLCEAFGEHFLSRTVVSEWYSHFNAGRVSVEDDKCSG
jgi:hypothetical protein